MGPCSCSCYCIPWTPHRNLDAWQPARAYEECNNVHSHDHHLQLNCQLPTNKVNAEAGGHR